MIKKTTMVSDLREALTYHHRMVNRWAYISEEQVSPADMHILWTEFQKMRMIVGHYEYACQHALEIQPTLMSDV